jgi:peptidoglycan/LPS O-acetylase OafA/YrhL
VIGYVPCFLGGVIAWNLSRSVTRRFAGWLWPLGFVLTWPFFFVAKHDNDMYFRWAFCLALGAAIPWFKEISFRPVQAAAYQVAKYSYGIYLTHLAVMLFCFGLPLPRPAQWVAFALLAVSCPVALYHLLEHPMILLGHKLAGPDSFAG